jgi:hypothetical protein
MLRILVKLAILTLLLTGSHTDRLRKATDRYGFIQVQRTKE